LNGIPWAIFGRVATRAYMPEQATRELDILVSETDGDQILGRLQQAGYQLLSPLRLPGHALRSPEGIQVNAYFGRQPWLEPALQSPTYDPAGFPVLALPYLILTRLLAPRIKDWADIARMLGLASDEELDEARAVITRYSPEDSQDLESFIILGRKELEEPPGESPHATRPSAPLS
jgi:hypothetical protein